MSDGIKERVRERYEAAAQAARRAAGPDAGGSCCPGAGCGCGPTPDDGSALLQDARGLYAEHELASLPLTAQIASLGCGNPVALAELREGEVVLDLGSGGGIDVLLSAARVGPTGKAYGVDMTDEMLALAEENRRSAGVENVEFLKGDIEALPLPDTSIDVIISNCVVNLATDKGRALREAFRVLRPGGRLAVSDIVFQGDAEAVSLQLREHGDAWTACVAGAMGEDEYRSRLRDAGFDEVSIDVTNVYDLSGDEGLCGVRDVDLPDGVRLVSAFVRARRTGP